MYQCGGKETGDPELPSMPPPPPTHAAPKDMTMHKTMAQVWGRWLEGREEMELWRRRSCSTSYRSHVYPNDVQQRSE